MSELSPETEELLARGRGGTPLSASRRDALKGAVIAKLATGAIVTTSTSAAAWTMTTKTIGVAVLAAVIGTGTVGVVKYERHARPSQAVTNTANTAAPITPPQALRAPVISEAPQRAPVVEPTSEAAPAVTVSSPTTQPLAQRSTTPNAHPSAPVANQAVGNDAPNHANSQAIVASNTPSNAGSSNETPNDTSAHPSSLEEETSLLRSAHDALAAGDPARALRLLDEHASRFPNSALEPERSAERVFAFCAQQRNDAAHAAAATFLAAHPNGPLAARVRSSCGGD